MELLTIIIFIIGYILIALEHPVQINKTATALFIGVICWVLFAFSEPSSALVKTDQYQNFIQHVTDGVKVKGTLHIEYVSERLGHKLNEIAQILFFLMGAMTIVELIDAHQGFGIVTDKIKTTNPKKLLWIVCWVTFFLSAVLDNLTTTIVMISLVRKLIPNRDMKLFFVGMIVIAANAGGAWSPIGDVTTTMLWIGGQISAVAIMKTTFLPSMVCMLVPLLYLNFTLKGTLGEAHHASSKENEVGSGHLMLIAGLGVLISVPVFKTVTHLPPYLGMMLGLSVLWVISEFINPDLDDRIKKKYTAAHALTRIDMPSVLFFLGILLAVGALESMATLQTFAALLNESIGDNRIIISLIGVLSSIVDNVPLVAASMGMYNLNVYPQDHMIWEFLAYCAGTGGSILIIGSAAGVAAMGMERVDFIWYLKKISLLAIAGYAGGALTYLLLN